MSSINAYRQKVLAYKLNINLDFDRELFTVLSCDVLYGEDGDDIINELGMTTAKKLFQEEQGEEWEEEDGYHSLALFALFQLFKTEHQGKLV